MDGNVIVLRIAPLNDGDERPECMVPVDENGTICGYPADYFFGEMVTPDVGPANLEGGVICDKCYQEWLKRRA